MAHPAQGMKRLLLFPAILLLNIFALQAQNCLLKTKTANLEGRTDITSYEHDSKTGLLTERRVPDMQGGQYLQTFTYYEGTLSRVETGEYYALYFVGDRDLVDGAIDYDDLNVSHSYKTYVYNAEGRMIKYTLFETPYLEDTVVVEYILYSYDGDKMVKEVSYMSYPTEGAEPTSTTVFEYSDHPNPEFNLVYNPQYTHKYVITKAACSTSDGIDEYNSYTCECSYNKHGYPEKCVSKYPDGSERSVVEYAYKCK
jgi:hypothetical protein